MIRIQLKDWVSDGRQRYLFSAALRAGILDIALLLRDEDPASVGLRLAATREAGRLALAGRIGILRCTLVRGRLDLEADRPPGLVEVTPFPSTTASGRTFLPARLRRGRHAPPSVTPLGLDLQTALAELGQARLGGEDMTARGAALLQRLAEQPLLRSAELVFLPALLADAVPPS